MSRDRARRTRRSRRAAATEFAGSRAAALGAAAKTWEWGIVILVAAVSFLAGTVGFMQYWPLAYHGQHCGWLNALYRSLQLFTLESGFDEQQVGLPPLLEFARFAAPVAAGYTAVKAILGLLRDQTVGLRLWWMQRHVVICGLGEKGIRLALAFRRAGYAVVVIDHNEEHGEFEQCRRNGILVLPGDATDAGVLRHARVDRATYVVAVCGSDGLNAQIAYECRRLIASPTAPRREGNGLTCYVHIEDPQLCAVLREREAAGTHNGFKVELFNVFESGARVLLTDAPAFTGADANAEGLAPVVVVVGLGRMGSRVIVHMARQWSIRRRDPHRKLRVTAVGRGAAERIEVLKLQYPPLDQACEFHPRDTATDSPEFQSGDFLLAAGDAPQRVFVCLDNDTESIAAALALREETQPGVTQVILYASPDDGLGGLMGGGRPAATSAPLPGMFGLLDHTCTVEQLTDWHLDTLARLHHRQWFEQRLAAGDTLQNNPHLRPWDDDVLDEEFRESSRREARRTLDRAQESVCGRVVPLEAWTPSFEMREDLVERYAREEHEAWLNERRAAGWTYGQVRDDNRKINPNLLPWEDEQLSDDLREYNRQTIRDIPRFLAEAGLQILPDASTASATAETD